MKDSVNVGIFPASPKLKESVQLLNIMSALTDLDIVFKESEDASFIIISVLDYYRFKEDLKNSLDSFCTIRFMEEHDQSAEDSNIQPMKILTYYDEMLSEMHFKLTNADLTIVINMISDISLGINRYSILYDNPPQRQLLSTFIHEYKSSMDSTPISHLSNKLIRQVIPGGIVYEFFFEAVRLRLIDDPEAVSEIVDFLEIMNQDRSRIEWAKLLWTDYYI